MASKMHSGLSAALVGLMFALVFGVAPIHAQEEDAVADAQTQAEQAFAAAQQMLDDEQYDEAINAYTRLIAATGSFRPEPYIKRAEAYAGLEDYEAAIKDLNDAMTYAGGLPQIVATARAKRGEIYLEQGNVGGALEDLQIASGDIRNDVNLKFFLGKAQVLAGLAAVGSETLTDYLGLEDPELEEREAEVLRLRAQAYAGLRRFDDAKLDLSRALEIDSSDHETYLAKAAILMIEEDYAAAAEAYGEVIRNYTPADENDELPPIFAYTSQARAYEEVGRGASDKELEGQAFEAARKQLETLLSLLPERPELAGAVAEIQLRLGIVDRLEGDLPAAIKAFTEAIDANPQAAPEFLAQAYYRRGICFFYRDEDQLALLDFEAAAGKTIEDPRANFWAGRTHVKLNDYFSAIRSYSAAIAVSDRYADAFVHRGLAYFQLKELDKAITDFNEAIRLKPAVGTPYYYRGVAFSIQGEPQKSINSYTTAIKFDPELVAAYRALAEELRRAGRGSLAGEYDRKANELEAEKAQASATGSGTR